MTGHASDFVGIVMLQSVGQSLTLLPIIILALSNSDPTPRHGIRRLYPDHAARRRRDRRGADGHLAARARADPFQLSRPAHPKRQLRRDAPAQAARRLFRQPWRGRRPGAGAGHVVGAGPARSQRARLYRRILAVLLAGDGGAVLRRPDHPRAAGPFTPAPFGFAKRCVLRKVG